MPEYNELLRELDENPCPHCQGRGWYSVQERSTGDEMQEQCDCHPPRAAAAIRKLREELASLETDAIEAGSRASKIISRLCAERDRLAAEVEKLREERDAWNDPESAERIALQEELLFSLGEGSRSEIELREGQLDAAEAALLVLRKDRDRLAAEVEGLREERDAARHNSLTESADRDRLAELVRELEQELDAARKTPVKALEAENEALWRILRELDSDGTMEERAKLRTDREALRTAVEIRDRKKETT